MDLKSSLREVGNIILTLALLEEKILQIHDSVTFGKHLFIVIRG